jgi:beta-barrel assembly-enhancing protease
MNVRAIVRAAALVIGLSTFAFSQSSTTSNPPDSGKQPASTNSQTTTQQPSQVPSPSQAPTQPTDSGSQAPAAQTGDSGSATPSTDASTPPPPAPPAASTTKESKEKVKPGSKDDVDAIGNRSVGKGGGLGNWYSLEKEIRMGKEFAQQVEASVKLVQDPVVNEYVNRIGQNLVRNSDARVPFTIKVVDSDEINAFALPGGFFYVNSGLILAADEEAELAGVMAHEIAHVAARHATRQMTRGQLANFASIPLIFVGGGIGYAISGAASLGLPLTFMSFSRGFEAEADYLGLEYMYKTGYDPQAFISFFEKVQAKEKKKPGSLAKAFASHPQTPDRIAKSQEEINNILPARPEYLVTTSEFDEVKARLAAIENRRKITDAKEDKNRPTLRRTTADSNKSDKSTSGSGNSTDNGNSKSDDDRPTLKRRDQD